MSSISMISVSCYIFSNLDNYTSFSNTKLTSEILILFVAQPLSLSLLGFDI